MSRLKLFALIAALALLLGACASGEEEVSTEDPVETPDEGADEGADEDADDDTGTELGEGVMDATPAFMAEAAQTTAAAESGRFRMVMELQGSSELPGDAVLLEGEGGFVGEDRAYLSFDMSGMMDLAMAADPGGASAIEGDPFAGAMLSMFDEPIEVVVDGDTTYMKMGFLTEMMGVTTPWVSSPTDDGDSGLSGDFQVDPGELVELLEGAGDVTEVGAEEIDGSPTVRYSVAVDWARLADSLGEAEAAELEEMASGAATVDVWIGEDGIVRRMQMEMDLSALGDLDMTGSSATLDGTLLMTIDLFDIGADVEIPVPDPSEVTPESEMGGAFGGAFQGQGELIPG